MNRATWAAIIAAIVFPSIALVIVIFDRQTPPALPPEAHQPLPPRWRGPLEDRNLVELRKQLALSDEQVKQIWRIGEHERRRMAGLHDDIHKKQAKLYTLLTAMNVEEDLVIRCLEELHGLRLEMDKLRVLTPLHLRGILTQEQRKKLVEIWNTRRRREPGRRPPPPGYDRDRPPPPPPPRDRPGLDDRPHHAPGHNQPGLLEVPVMPKSADE